MSIWTVVPVKPLHNSKTRLAHFLSAAQRVDLMAGFLAQTLAVLQQVPAIAHVLVTSSDPAVWAIAHRYGAEILPEAQPAGLNAAVTQAVTLATIREVTATLILPADLPFIQVEEVEQMLAALPDVPGSYENGTQMAICPDRRHSGTNALLLDPAAGFTFYYGAGSFQRHLQEAKRLGLARAIIQAPGLTFDLDTEEDWLFYQQRHYAMTT